MTPAPLECGLFGGSHGPGFRVSKSLLKQLANEIKATGCLLMLLKPDKTQTYPHPGQRRRVPSQHPLRPRRWTSSSVLSAGGGCLGPLQLPHSTDHRPGSSEQQSSLSHSSGPGSLALGCHLVRAWRGLSSWVWKGLPALSSHGRESGHRCCVSSCFSHMYCTVIISTSSANTSIVTCSCRSACGGHTHGLLSQHLALRQSLSCAQTPRSAGDSSSTDTTPSRGPTVGTSPITPVTSCRHPPPNATPLGIISALT